MKSFTLFGPSTYRRSPVSLLIVITAPRLDTLMTVLRSSVDSVHRNAPHSKEEEAYFSESSIEVHRDPFRQASGISTSIHKVVRQSSVLAFIFCLHEPRSALRNATRVAISVMEQYASGLTTRLSSIYLMEPDNKDEILIHL